jgi:hypothetical protein
LFVFLIRTLAGGDAQRFQHPRPFAKSGMMRSTRSGSISRSCTGKARRLGFIPETLP